MPKKRFTSQYSKPQSTVHPSLASDSARTSPSSKKDGETSVNDLIASARSTIISSTQKIAIAPHQQPSLPPQIRQILAQPEVPTPAPRRRIRTGYAGPPPPRSWLESRHAPKGARLKSLQRVHPTDVYHLPGIRKSNGRRLQDMCMRQMARYWEDIRQYEQNNLAELPTQLRMELLSFIAVDGPDEGIGLDGLRNIIIPQRPGYGDDGPYGNATRIVESQTLVATPENTVFTEEPLQPHRDAQPENSPLEDWDDDQSSAEFELRRHNDNFHRLDLSGSIGNSVSLKQLTSFVERPSLSVAATIPLLTHLSIAYPAPSVSWRNLLAFSQHLPALTHLSLACWPTPSLTANSRTAVMTSPHGRDVQYGGTNYYSHSLDDDFQEAADILRRLAGRLYGLEYLDLSGCISWIRALRWNGSGMGASGSAADEMGIQNAAFEGIDWAHQWLKLSTLKLNSLSILRETSDMLEITHFIDGVHEQRSTQYMLSWWTRKGKRKGTWVEVRGDDHRVYDDLWRGVGRKRTTLNILDMKRVGDGDIRWTPPVIPSNEEGVRDDEGRQEARTANDEILPSS